MVPPELVLLERSYGLIHSKALMLAAELGIADQLEQGPQTADQLARVVDANPDALDRMLAFLGLGRPIGSSQGRPGTATMPSRTGSDATIPSQCGTGSCSLALTGSGTFGTSWGIRYGPAKAGR